MRKDQSGSYYISSERGDVDPQISCQWIVSGWWGIESEGWHKYNSEIQGMKMVWSGLAYHSHPKGPKQKQSKPLLKIISFVCMQSRVKMQLKWDESAIFCLQSIKHKNQIGLPVLSFLNVSTPHIKMVANQYKTDVWLFLIINQIWGKPFKVLSKRGHYLHRWRVREVISCLLENSFQVATALCGSRPLQYFR